MMLLDVDGVGRDFAGLRALDNVSFGVAKGSITSLIGPNGAGKTTLINIITGVLAPSRGDVRFRDLSTVRIGTTRVAGLGIRRTFQTVRLFPGLTVLENLMIGRFCNEVRQRWWQALLPLRIGDAARRRQAQDLLDRFDLMRHADTIATELPYGTQRRVEIVRALAGEPALVLLDEPAAGMNEAETEHLREDIRAVRKAGVTVLLVEHDMDLVMRVSDRVVVLDFGRKIAEGSPEEVQRDAAVISSYLGYGI
ncbi:ABC transporter ATP-binding protein [Xanthobacter autotrophicus]|uniref:ABC transporter ATP-binding protein n=1 Tax=Xanthobacter autotrophicus TaxID=280 RepID=UPI00372A26AE